MAPFGAFSLKLLIVGKPNGIFLGSFVMRYVPILKGKAGEFGALRELSENSRDAIAPFFDVPRIPLNSDGKPARTVDKHLNKFVSGIIGAWDTERLAFFDIYDLDLHSRVEGGEHPVNYVADHLYEADIRLVVSTGLDRDNEYQTAVRKAQKTLGRGICIRLLRDDIDAVAITSHDLEKLAQKIGIAVEEIDLLLDFRALQPEAVSKATTAAKALINGLPAISEYRSLTVASSGFPQSMAGIAPDTSTLIPRTELELWRGLDNSDSVIERLPNYSDYGVVHPDLKDINPRVMKASAKIRYTLDQHWLVLKGRGLHSHPRRFKQYHDLSSELVADSTSPHLQ